MKRETYMQFKQLIQSHNNSPNNLQKMTIRENIKKKLRHTSRKGQGVKLKSEIKVYVLKFEIVSC